MAGANGTVSGSSRRAKLAIRDIIVKDRKRKTEEIDSLAESIKEIGLLNPITVSDKNILIAGLRRLTACKKLGWQEIDACVLSLDGMNAELAEIDENLIRADLTVLERGQQLRRRKEIYEAKHPETRHGYGPGRGHKEKRRQKDDSFSRDTAKKTGRSQRTVEREVQIAESLTNETQEIIEGTDLADHKTELLNLARVPEEKQAAVAEKVVSGEATTVAQAKRLVEREAKQEALEKTASQPPPSDLPRWEAIHGDNVAVMAKRESGIARLAFADPPYNIGVDYYGTGKREDLLPPDKYIALSREWIAQVARLLTPDGSLWVLISDEYADHVAIALTEAGLYRRQWLIWYESFGVNNANGFNRCSRHLLWYVKDRKNFVFNENAVLRPSDREAKYGDKRAQPGGKTWDSVWGVNPPIPRVVDNAKERVPGFPTQLPLALLRPIVGCASDPGDLILDPFSGSGTTGEAALTSGRRYLGIEKNKEAHRLSLLRLKGVRSVSG